NIRAARKGARQLVTQLLGRGEISLCSSLQTLYLL
ncbi:hypothetical protein HaLaN_21969, partial [Haematococcus lacustris]